MDFRGKQWKRNGNHYNLVGSPINIYYWNSGKNQNYMIEILGLSIFEKNTITIPGKGQAAKDAAITKALELYKEMKQK